MEKQFYFRIHKFKKIRNENGMQKTIKFVRHENNLALYFNIMLCY